MKREARVAPTEQEVGNNLGVLLDLLMAGWIPVRLWGLEFLVRDLPEEREADIDIIPNSVTNIPSETVTDAAGKSPVYMDAKGNPYIKPVPAAPRRTVLEGLLWYGPETVFFAVVDDRGNALQIPKSLIGQRIRLTIERL